MQHVACRLRLRWLHVLPAAVLLAANSVGAQVGGSSCPDWSTKFDAVNDASMRKTLQTHREAGWDAVISEGEKLGIGLREQIADGERQLNISRAAEIRATSGLSSRRIAPRDRKAPDCSQAEASEKDLACQARLRHNEVLALEGMLDLLRCRSPAHPSPAYRPEGRTIATFQVVVTPSARTPARSDDQDSYAHARVLGMEQDGQTIQLEQGSYIVLRFEPKDGAIGFTLDPDQRALQFNKDTVHLPKGVVGILKAATPGRQTITILGGPGPTPPPDEKTKEGTALKNASLSTNWAGYIKAGSPFEFVRGEWVVPAVSSSAAGDLTVWVGIDGSTNSSLIQAGTSHSYSNGFLGIGSGSSHYAWWEILPAFETPIPNLVLPGDTIVVTISPLPGTTAPPNTSNFWVISIRNSTEGWTYSTIASYNAPLNSAEWIVEDPTQCGLFGCSLAPLPGFANVTFDVSNSVATGASPPAPPSFSATEASLLAQSGVILASPSAPDCDMDGFTVAAGATAPAPPGPFFLNSSLPGGNVGVPYNTRLFVSGLVGLAPFTEGIELAQSSPPLPPGLTLSEQDGTITGTPTTTGTFPFTASVTDVGTFDDLGNMASCSAPMSIAIFPSFPNARFRVRCVYLQTTHRLVCF